jgi:hypothetical protein
VLDYNYKITLELGRILQIAPFFDYFRGKWGIRFTEICRLKAHGLNRGMKGSVARGCPKSRKFAEKKASFLYFI